MLTPSRPGPSPKASGSAAAPSHAARGLSRAAPGLSYAARGERAVMLAALWEIVTRGPLVTDGHRSDLGAAEGMIDGWRVPVRVADVREAWEAWLAARNDGAPAERVQDLRDELDRLARAAAEQGTDVAERPFARRSAAHIGIVPRQLQH
jgi:hypothetical protein